MSDGAVSTLGERAQGLDHLWSSAVDQAVAGNPPGHLRQRHQTVATDVAKVQRVLGHGHERRVRVQVCHCHRCPGHEARQHHPGDRTGILASELQRPVDELPTLLPLKVGGSRPPLFVIHGGKGDVLFARSLALHLDDEQPLYALQPPPLMGGRTHADASVEVLAQRYARSIDAVAGSRPALIFGFSFGALVAYEIVLQRQERTTGDWLGVGDLSAPSMPQRSVEAAVGEYLGGRGVTGTVLRGGRRLVSLRELGVRRGASEATAVGRRAVTRTIARVRTPWWERQEETRRQAALIFYATMGQKYHQTAVFDGPTLVVRSTEYRSRFPADDLGWGAHLARPAQVLAVDCRHRDLVREPHLTEVARALGEAHQRPYLCRRHHRPRIAARHRGRPVLRHRRAGEPPTPCRRNPLSGRLP